jgi:uncharacterized membrane protein
MTWLRRYRARHYVENSLWIFPVLSMVVAIALAHLLHWIERRMVWESTVAPDTARDVLGTMASALFTFIVFVSSALLVSVQLASAQLTPRVIGQVFKDPVTRWSLTLFVFTFTFSLAVLVRISASVPLLTGYVAGYGSLLSLGVFLYLIDHVGRVLRPSGALRAVGILGREVIASVYPRRLEEPSAPFPEPIVDWVERPARTIASLEEGVVLALDVEGLVSLARRADCVIEMVPQVGDSIAEGDPLFRIAPVDANLPVDVLHQSVALGQERTLEQDPTFVFRILVDIASKGLSPAINDPTTAVLAIDQIHHLLRDVGGRRLDDERVRDATGQLRLLYRTPDWKDFVHLAVTEIRHFGGASIQIARRLRAMLDHLIQTLPQERTELLRQELKLLDRSTDRFFMEPEDRALADVSDVQGVGGHGHLQPDRQAEELTPP